MRWSSWLGACVIWACALQAPRDGGESRAASGCATPRVVRDSLHAERHDLPTTPGLCERAWNETGNDEAAATGALYARRIGDESMLKRWFERAPRTPQGARIMHFWGEVLVGHGDLEAAEDTLHQALDLQIDRDPTR